ncbi:MAG: alpha/beta hydrolase, partial [Phycisphaeraceae bacterium]
MATLLLTLLLLYPLYLLAGCGLQRSLLFPRHVIGPVDSNEHVQQRLAEIEGEQWWLETEAGPVEAWFLPGDGATAESPGPAIVLSHGNAEVIDYLPEQVAPFRRLGISVLLPEYRGYGRSAGKPSQAAIVDDLTAFHDRLTAREDIDQGRIVLLGRSVGTGVATALADRRPPAAMILQSPFTSVADIMAGYGIPRPFVLDPFDNAAVLEKLDRPLLLQHGRRDTIIAYHHSETLHALAPNATLINYDAGHNDMPITTAAYWQDITNFLTTQGILTPPPTPQ